MVVFNYTNEMLVLSYMEKDGYHRFFIHPGDGVEVSAYPKVAADVVAANRKYVGL